MGYFDPSIRLDAFFPQVSPATGGAGAGTACESPLDYGELCQAQCDTGYTTVSAGTVIDPGTSSTATCLLQGDSITLSGPTACYPATCALPTLNGLYAHWVDEEGCVSAGRATFPGTCRAVKKPTFFSRFYVGFDPNPDAVFFSSSPQHCWCAICLVCNLCQPILLINSHRGSKAVTTVGASSVRP